MKNGAAAFLGFPTLFSQLARELLQRPTNRAVTAWVSLLPDHPMLRVRFFSARCGHRTRGRTSRHGETTRRIRLAWRRCVRSFGQAFWLRQELEPQRPQRPTRTTSDSRRIDLTTGPRSRIRIAIQTHLCALCGSSVWDGSDQSRPDFSPPFRFLPIERVPCPHPCVSFSRSWRF